MNIDKVRNQVHIPDEFLISEKFQVDQYHNPYLTKLTIKIHPQISSINNKTFFKLWNPIYDHDQISIRQSLPLYKSSKLLLSMNWRQDIRKNYNLTHLGGMISYKFDNGIKLKWRNMVGISMLNQIKLKKQLKFREELLEFYGIYSGFREQKNNNYHTVGVGAKYKNLSVGLNKKIDSDLNIRASYQKIIKNGLYLQLNTDTLAQNSDQTIFEAGIGYYWRKGFSAWLKTIVQPFNITEEIPRAAVQFHAKLKNDTFLASIEYRQNKSLLYVGYKCPSFNFIFPILGTQSPIPILIGIGLFMYGYFYRKQQERPKRKQKQQSDRVEQLKLISDKAGQIYKKQQNQNGLLIEEVYIGPYSLLSDFLQSDRIILHQNNQIKNNIYDVTVSFRFYVQKGELSLPKGSKLDMLGCYYKNNDDNRIFISYTKGGQKHQVLCQEDDQILI